jgi:hypothetical protein
MYANPPIIWTTSSRSKPVLERFRQIALERAVHNVRRERCHARVVEAEPPEQARPEVLDQDIGPADQPPRHIPAGQRRRIQGKAALVAAIVGEEPGCGALEGPGAITLGWLDLDDVGTEVGQDEAAGRPHHHLAEFDDAHPRERAKTRRPLLVCRTLTHGRCLPKRLYFL